MTKNKFIKKEKRRIKQEWKNIFFNCIFAFLAVIIPSLFYRNILLTTAILLLIAIIGLIKWKSKITLTIFIFGAFWGPLSEMIAIYFGAWHYTLFNFYTIPLWLFLVWGDAAAFLYETAKEFKKLGVKD